MLEMVFYSNQLAARSLVKGLEETLTLHRLGVFPTFPYFGLSTEKQYQDLTFVGAVAECLGPAHGQDLGS